MHSYVSLAFYFLGAAIKQEVVAQAAREMQAKAAYDRCGLELERDGWYGCCSCGDHTMHEVGDGNGESVVWR